MRIKGCGNSEHKIGYWGKYDLYGCEVCDKWTEELCNCEPRCTWFSKPPEKPSLTGEKPEGYARKVVQPNETSD
jgi:hypothetical protein